MPKRREQRRLMPHFLTRLSELVMMNPSLRYHCERSTRQWRVKLWTTWSVAELVRVVAVTTVQWAAIWICEAKWQHRAGTEKRIKFENVN